MAFEGLKFFDPRNTRMMVDLAKISSGLDKHMLKKCAYCDLELGTGQDTPVVEFIDHLVEKHPDKIEAKDVEGYRKIIDKVTK